MGNLCSLDSSLPIVYDSYKNELIIKNPPGLKVRFLNDVDLVTENNFNLLSFGQVNLCSVENDINLDSVNATIHLNSRRAIQLDELRKIIIIDSDNNLFKQRQSLLMGLNRCLNKIIENTSLPK